MGQTGKSNRRGELEPEWKPEGENLKAGANALVVRWPAALHATQK